MQIHYDENSGVHGINKELFDRKNVNLNNTVFRNSKRTKTNDFALTKIDEICRCFYEII